MMRVLGQRAQIPVQTLPPSTLIRELYSAGEIAREPLERLIRLLPVRNQLVHGFRGPERRDVQELLDTAQLLFGELRAEEE